MQNAMASGISNICTYAHLHMYLFQTISSRRYMFSLRDWMLSNNGIVTSWIAQTMTQSLTSHVYIHAQFTTLFITLIGHAYIFTLLCYHHTGRVHLIATTNLLYVTDSNYQFLQHLLHCDQLHSYQLPHSCSLEIIYSTKSKQ